MSCPLLPLGFNWVPTTCRLYEVLAEQMQSKKKKKKIRPRGLNVLSKIRRQLVETVRTLRHTRTTWLTILGTTWPQADFLQLKPYENTPPSSHELEPSFRDFSCPTFTNTLMLRTLSVISGNRNWVLRPLVQEMVHVLWWMAINFLAKNKPSGMNVHTPS